MDEKRFAEIVASMVGEDRGVLEQYCVELVAEVRRLREELTRAEERGLPTRAG